MLELILFDDLPSSDSCWDKWRQMMFDEGWTNVDRSVCELMPQLPTTRTVVAKDSEGNTVCHLMWSEYDGLSYVQTFLTDVKYRGKGIGKKVWQKAMGRINKENTTMMLKSVPDLTDFYKKEGFSIEGPKNFGYSAPCTVFIEIFRKLTEGNDKVIQPVTPELFNKWVEYFALDYAQTLCILDKHGDISGTISIVPSQQKEKTLYKVSSLYTSLTHDAAALLFKDSQIIEENNPKSIIGFYGLEGSRGSKEFDEVLIKHPEVEKHYICILLTNKEYNNPIDFDKLFIASNSDCHYDA